jgi:hypothetical protein
MAPKGPAVVTPSQVLRALSHAGVRARLGKTANFPGLGQTKSVDDASNAKKDTSFMILVFASLRDVETQKRQYAFLPDGTAETREERSDLGKPPLVSVVKFYGNVEFVWFYGKQPVRGPRWHAIDMALTAFTS